MALVARVEKDGTDGLARTRIVKVRSCWSLRGVLIQESQLSIGGKGGVQSVALRCGKGSPGRTSPVRWSGQWSALKRGFNKMWGAGLVPSGSLLSNGGGTTSGYVACCLRSALNWKEGRVINIITFALRTANCLDNRTFHATKPWCFLLLHVNLEALVFTLEDPRAWMARTGVGCHVLSYLVPSSQLTESRLLCTWKEG